MQIDSIDALLKNSFIIINKPPGITSHEVTNCIKKICGVSRSGHAGTLDPNVSGVLPIALGKATKLLRYVAGNTKTYIGIIKFKKQMKKSDIEKLFEEFTGEIIQTPPKISAVRKVPRKRRIYHLKLLEMKGRMALFESKVDAGTYIRTLCRDIGKKCGGARMEELRRISVGEIGEKEAFTIQEVVDAKWFYKNKGDSSQLHKMLRSPESLIDLPKVFIKKSSLESVKNGAQIMAPAIERIEEVEKEGKVAIYCEDKFVGIGIAKISDKGIKTKKKGFAVMLERIHIL